MVVVKNQLKTSKNIDEPCLPLPKPRGDFEYARESQFLLWLYRTMQEISYGHEYEQYLRDGVLLCRLMQYLAPEIISKQLKLEPGHDKRMKEANIRRFLDSCRRFGLTNDQLFDVEDLLSMLDIPRVTRCLFALGKQVAEKNGSKKPFLGEPYDQWLTNQMFNKDQIAQITQIGSKIYRRAGMPFGDDVLVSHVDTEWVKKLLDTRKDKDANRIRRPAPDPLVQRTPSKPLAELKALFANPETRQKSVESHSKIERRSSSFQSISEIKKVIENQGKSRVVKI